MYTVVAKAQQCRGEAVRTPINIDKDVGAKFTSPVFVGAKFTSPAIM